MEQQATRILIIHQGALGDFILSLPAMSALRYSHPHTTIEIWGHLEILRLVDKSPYADAVYSIERERIAPLYTSDNPVPAGVMERFRQFDLIFIFGGEQHKTFVHNLKKGGIENVHRIDPFPPPGSTTHVIDHQASQLTPLGLNVPLSRPALFPHQEVLQRVTPFLERLKTAEGGLAVALHPGSGSRAKVWPPWKFAQLGRHLLEDDRVRIIVPIGPADREHAEHFLSLIPDDRIIPLSNLSLSELAGTLKRCTLYIGNDSGVSHMAAAVGIPVVALFGPTDPQVWGPRGKGVYTVYRNVACSPCSREEMNACLHRKCLEEITVEEVYRKTVQDG